MKVNRFDNRSDSDDVGHDDWPRWLLLDYRETEPWHNRPASERQIEALERRGYALPNDLTRGEAHHALGLATPKQRRALERRGLWRPGMTFEEAGEALRAVAREEGWTR